MKHFKLLLLLIPLLFITDVKADTIKRYYIQDTDGTKSTWWNAYPTSGYDYTYTNQYIVVDYLDSPEKYVVLSTCLTGDLDMQITSNLRGNIEYLEYQTGASCQVKDQTWVGRMFYYIFKVNEYYDPNAQNELYVSFDLKVANYNTYLVYQDIFRVETYSNYPNLGTNDKEFEDIKDGLDNIEGAIGDTNDKLDNTNEKLDDLNDSLNDSDTTGATNEAGNFFSGFETNTFGLTSIITAPLDLISSITSSSCSPLPLTVPFVDKSFNLPCMITIYEEYFGSFLDIYQTITFGIVAYWVCVRIFALVKDFKNPDHDEIEVLDL